jgi:hypothetical protein
MRRRVLSPISATSAIYEHNPRSPETPFASSTHHLAVTLSSRAFAPSDRRRMRPGWREHPCGCHASRASSEQDQIGSRRTGAAHFCDPLGVTIDAHYPDPFWLGHPLSRARGSPAGEADRSGRLRTLAEPAVDFSVHRRHAFARPALPPDLLSLAGWPKGPLPTLPREEDRDPRSQGVFHL